MNHSSVQMNQKKWFSHTERESRINAWLCYFLTGSHFYLNEKESRRVVCVRLCVKKTTTRQNKTNFCFLLERRSRPSCQRGKIWAIITIILPAAKELCKSHHWFSLLHAWTTAGGKKNPFSQSENIIIKKRYRKKNKSTDSRWNSWSERVNRSYNIRLASGAPTWWKWYGTAFSSARRKDGYITAETDPPDSLLYRNDAHTTHTDYYTIYKVGHVYVCLCMYRL